MIRNNMILIGVFWWVQEIKRPTEIVDQIKDLMKIQILYKAKPIFK